MNRLGATASVLAALLVSIVVVLAVVRVGALMDRELDRAGPRATLAAGTRATLLEADLLEGDFLTFELCSGDAMDPARWSGALGLRLEAGASEPRDLVLDETMDDAMLAGARRGPAGACLDFARAGPLEVGGHYVVSAQPTSGALDGVNVRARVVAERPLGPPDRNVVLGILLGAIAFVIALALRTPTAAEPRASGAWSMGAAWGLAGPIALLSLGLIAIDPRLSLVGRLVLALVAAIATLGSGLALRRGISGAGAILGVVAIVDLSTLFLFVPIPGPAFGLVAGVVLALAEVGIALGLARTFSSGVGVGRALAMERPKTVLVAWASFVAAPIVGVLLRIAAGRALSLVPSTGEAPIEAYVSWPSGLLSFAALSAIAPIGEEVFFRGLVYGALLGQGGRGKTALAFVGAWLLFVVAHLPQTWGSWGGLLAIAIAGLGFTALRAVTGSVLVAALAHLVYNGLTAAAALAS